MFACYKTFIDLPITLIYLLTFAACFFFLLLLKKLAICSRVSNTLGFAKCVPVMLFNGFLCYCKLQIGN